MRARDDRGVAIPSPLVILSIVAVAMAGIAFLATNGDDGNGKMTPVSRPDSSSSPSAPVSPSGSTASTAPSTPAASKPPEIDRAKVYVEVYNKSNRSGLAKTTGTKATDAGWQVVGMDNWVGGNIPASTVYYPTRLKAEAQLLAKDLGIERTVAAVDPMKFDRLTVILTADYSG